MGVTGQTATSEAPNYVDIFSNNNTALIQSFDQGYQVYTLSTQNSHAGPFDAWNMPDSFRAGMFEFQATDTPVGMDIWHNTAQCSGCANLWQADYNGMNKITAGYAALYGGVLLGATYGPAALATVVRSGASAASAIGNGVDAAQLLLREAMLNPEVIQGTMDFLDGWNPAAAAPTTIPGVIGAVVAGAPDIWEEGEKAYDLIREAVPH